jgi:HEAT repeat protein
MRALILFGLVVSAAAQTPENAYETLRHGLADANPAKRISALLALSVAKPAPEPVGLVEGMLADKDSGTRAAACSALGEMKSRGSQPKLEAALDDKAPEVIFAAAKALYAMGDPKGRAVLIEVLLGDRSDKSGLVTSSLRDAKLKLHDPRALVLLGVNEGAGFAGPFGLGVPITEMVLADNQASGKTAAALLLSSDRTEGATGALRGALGDKNWTVRAAAVRALALLDANSCYDDIASLLDDKRDEVRYAAAGAMIRLKQTQKPARSTHRKNS